MNDLEESRRLVSALDSPDGQVIVGILSAEMDRAMRVLLMGDENLARAQGSAQAFHKVFEKFVRARQIVEAARKQNPENIQ